MDVRVIADPAGAAAWNMAVDQALLESVDQHVGTTLRFYQWDPAALSLGYFQPSSARGEHPASAPLTCVRRSTGGGAIIHDRELTYCLVSPVSDRFRGRTSWVNVMHEALVRVLHGLSLPAELCSVPNPQREESFLCFERRAELDVLVDGRKICGSAQRRGKRAALVHGSVLLERSPHAPELPGLRDLGNCALTAAELIEHWKTELAGQLGWRLQPGQLRAEERNAANRWRDQRFANPAWTLRR